MRAAAATVELGLEEVQAARRRKRDGQRLEEEAEQLSGSLLGFLRAGWHVLEPRPFVSGFHIEAICEHLEAARHGEIDRLLINIPPRHMKSLAVSVFWQPWRWTFEPDLKFLSGSHISPLSQRDAVKSRDVIMSRWFQARWPHVQLKGDVNRVSRYENTATGYRIATHVGGGTGDGGDILILDDPHEASEAQSDAKRSAVIAWHGNTWASRFNDPTTGVEVVVMQRLHQDDLSGHLIAQGGWTHLCLPAQYDRKHPFVWPDDPRSTDNPPVDGIDQGDDSLLWPARFPQKALDTLAKDMTAFVAAGQLQQLPAPREGAMLKRADWRYYTPRLSFYSETSVFGPDEALELAQQMKFDRIVGAWDTSVKDRETSDYVSGQVWACAGANRYLLRLFHERVGLNGTIEAMVELKQWADRMWPNLPGFVIIEAAATGPDAAKEIRSRVQGVLEPIKAKGPKEMRAEAAGVALEGHNCYLPGWMDPDGSTYDARTPTDVQEFVEELAVFNNGSHDDQVDGWSLMVNWSRGRAHRVMHMTG